MISNQNKGKSWYSRQVWTSGHPPETQHARAFARRLEMWLRCQLQCWHVPFIWRHIDQSHIPTISPTLLAVCFVFLFFFFLMKSLECIFELHEWVYLREKRISRTFWLATQAVAGETWKRVAEDTQTLVSVIAQRPACYKQSRIWLEFPRQTSNKKNDTRHASLPITSFLYSSKGIPRFRW